MFNLSQETMENKIYCYNDLPQNDMIVVLDSQIEYTPCQFVVTYQEHDCLNILCRQISPHGLWCICQVPKSDEIQKQHQDKATTVTTVIVTWKQLGLLLSEVYGITNNLMFN